MSVVFVCLVRVLVKIVEVKSQGVKYVDMIQIRNISTVLLVMRFVQKVLLQMMKLLNVRGVMLVVLFANLKIQKYVQNVMILYIYTKANVFQYVQQILGLASLEKLVSQNLLYQLFTSLFGSQLFLCYLFQSQVNLAPKMYQDNIEFSCRFIVGLVFLISYNFGFQ